MTALTPEFWAHFLGPPRETMNSSSMQLPVADHVDSDWEDFLFDAALLEYQLMLVMVVNSSQNQ